MKNRIAFFTGSLLLFSLSCNLTASNLRSQGTLTNTSTSTSYPTSTQSPTATASPTPRALPPSTALDLVIVTPAEFISALQPLADYKNKTGMATDILTLEEVYQSCPGVDTPEQIKRCLALYKQKAGIRYAMLVGDADKFPLRYIMADVDAPKIHNSGFYVADLYYADLFNADGSFNDWDANHNGYYGEIGGQIRPGPLNIDKVDLDPDIAVGRVPVSTLAETQTYVEKVIRYESTAEKASWSHRALMLATTSWVPDACKVQEESFGTFPKAWEKVRLYTKDSPCQTTTPLNPDSFLQEFNKGVGFVSYIGHGLNSMWADVITIEEMPKLTNASALPIVFSLGCGTAEFGARAPADSYLDVNGVSHPGSEPTDLTEQQKEYLDIHGELPPDAGETFSDTPPPPAPIQTVSNIESIMEYFLVKMPSGAVIYIGAITGGQPYSLDLNRYFFEAIGRGAPTVGEAWNNTIRTYYKNHRFEATYTKAEWYILADFHQPWKYLLFGDPSLRIGGVPAS
jgi:hypothetical protein